jgi:precorrin-6B methylase 2
MSGIKLAGGPTQDEIMAVSLFKLGLRNTDTVLEIGCGTGKISVAAAQQAQKIFSIDKRPEAITIVPMLLNFSSLTDYSIVHLLGERNNSPGYFRYLQKK